VYVEAHVVDDSGQEVEIIYGDYPSLEGLDVGTKTPITRINPHGNEIRTGEFEILAREIQSRPNTGTNMINLTLRRTI